MRIFLRKEWDWRDLFRLINWDLLNMKRNRCGDLLIDRCLKVMNLMLSDLWKMREVEC